MPYLFTTSLLYDSILFSYLNFINLRIVIEYSLIFLLRYPNSNVTLFAGSLDYGTNDLLVFSRPLTFSIPVNPTIKTFIPLGNNMT